MVIKVAYSGLWYIYIDNSDAFDRRVMLFPRWVDEFPATKREREEREQALMPCYA